MPNLASRNHSGVLYCVKESHVGKNGPEVIELSDNKFSANNLDMYKVDIPANAPLISVLLFIIIKSGTVKFAPHWLFNWFIRSYGRPMSNLHCVICQSFDLFRLFFILFRLFLILSDRQNCMVRRLIYLVPITS